jgi:hypothetical protein
VNELPGLNSFFELPQNRAASLKALREFLQGRNREVPPTILVTHQVTISALSGVGAYSGEGVLIEVSSNDTYTVRGRLRFGQD